MINIYQYTCYKSFIRDFVEKKKQLRAEFNYQKMGEITSIPKSYISRVFANKADFSQDQLFKVSNYMDLNLEETEYMSLLLEYSRSAFHQRKKFLKSKIDRIRKLKSNTEDQMNSRPTVHSETIGDTEWIEKYYADPMIQIVHIALHIPTYQKDYKKLREHLMITDDHFSQIFEKLVKLGMIKVNGSKNEILKCDSHLSRQSHLYPIFRDQLRSLGCQKMRISDQEKFYSFSVVFTTDKKARQEIQKAFFDFLNFTRYKVENSKTKHCYQLNFDLFNWDDL